VFNPEYWCDSECETRTLIDFSGQPELDINEVVYALNAFWATLKPVALSLLLSSLAVIYIQSEATRQDKQSGLKVYDISDDDAVTDDEGGDSNSQKLGKSLINAIVIICVIATFTFVLVFCYWMKCMKFLLGYMIFSSGILLSLLGGIIWYTALIKWELPCDAYTFCIVLYNFAIVGIIAIFYQKGIPTVVTQSYLVCTSVILAWQLARFDEWTCWALLLMLALYDLCAVLTPCGPLRMLVGLMQERNEPLPGLLYEANLPQPQDYSVKESSNPPSRSYNPPDDASDGSTSGRSENSDKCLIPSPMSLGVGIGMGSLAMMMTDSSDHTPAAPAEGKVSSNTSDGGDMESSGHGLLSRSQQQRSSGSMGHTVDLRRRDPESLAAASAANTLDLSQDDEFDKDHSIKLGLGDFVFYSVLVSRAATYGFTTFMSCYLVILGGLGMTLVLLAVFRKALPALPISIFLGIAFYLCTRFFIVPFVEASGSIPIYM